MTLLLQEGPFAELQPVERDRLLDLALEVTAVGESWLRDYPVVKRPSVTAACALAAAVGMPRLEVAELGIMTRWWLWIFGVDDVFDDPGVPADHLATWAARFAGDSPAGGTDLLLDAFESIHDDLRRYPVFAALETIWCQAMGTVVRGMLLESRWSGTCADLPGYEAYLANGMETIAVRPYALTACAVAGRPAAAREFTGLDSLIDTAARCFRLANDLRSDARERSEGKINAVRLLEDRFRAQGSARDEATRAARRSIAETCRVDLAFLRGARDAASPSLAELTRFLWAHSAFVWALYRHHDYDTASAWLLSPSGARPGGDHEWRSHQQRL